MNFFEPKFVQVVKHATLLIVLTILSASIGPLYTLLVGWVTHITPSIPPGVQEFLPLILPILGALVTKFQDAIKAELQDQEYDQLATKNIQLLHENTVMSKTLNAQVSSASIPVDAKFKEQKGNN